MHREHLIGRVETFLSRQSEELIAAYLFGSWGRGTANRRSDVDVALLFDNPPPPKLDSAPFRLESELELELGKPVQIVTLNNCPPDLTHRVLRDGVIVLDRDRAERIRFEVKARNEFFDLQPILERYRHPEPQKLAPR